MSLSQKAYNKHENFVVALDGPSASGKGLIGSLLAKELDLVYVQSSIVYRGLAYICIEDNVDINNIDQIIKISSHEDIVSRVEGVDLQIEEIGNVASKIAVIPEVRENLGKYLKQLIDTKSRIIMEGRDIGTVVAPNADLKIFITANIEVRANRRFKQLQSEGKECILSNVLTFLKERDDLDKSRKAAPLIASQGALMIDTTSLSPAQVLKKIKDFIAK